MKRAIGPSSVIQEHTPFRKKIKRNQFIQYHIDDCWQIDLVDVSKLKYANSHYRYWFTCIDVFSKYGWVEPIKSKTSEETTRAIKQIFAEGRKPICVQADSGREFMGEFARYLESLDIKFYSTHSRMKASICERFNRTIREKVWRYMTHIGSKHYLSHLQDIVYNYNHSFHRSIKTKPANVSKLNEAKIFKNLYGFDRSLGPNEPIKPMFTKGEFVRICLDRNVFSRGYDANFSKELYIINQVLPRIPPSYKLINLDGDKLSGIFYKEELLKSEQDYDIYKILKSKNNKLLVEQLNSNNSESIWVEADFFGYDADSNAY